MNHIIGDMVDNVVTISRARRKTKFKTASLDSANKSWDDIVQFLNEAGIPVSAKMDAEMREVENNLKALGLEYHEGTY